jgi:UDPglucose 6-dehydrogenase
MRFTAALLQVADYWRMVIDINDYQKQRYVERVISGMFNTVSNKKIAVSGMQRGWPALQVQGQGQP